MLLASSSIIQEKEPPANAGRFNPSIWPDLVFVASTNRCDVLEMAARVVHYATHTAEVPDSFSESTRSHADPGCALVRYSGPGDLHIQD
jgi:hypothetical protein